MLLVHMWYARDSDENLCPHGSRDTHRSGCPLIRWAPSSRNSRQSSRKGIHVMGHSDPSLASRKSCNGITPRPLIGTASSATPSPLASTPSAPTPKYLS